MTVHAEERLQVLKMIDSGKISVDEGSQLLTALEATNSQSGTGSNARSIRHLAGKRMHLLVSNLHTGQIKARASLPLRLLEVGLLIGAHYTAELKGVRLESILAALTDGLEGKIIEVMDQEKQIRVEVLVE